MRNAPKLRCTSYPQFFCCQREKDLRSKDSSGKPWTEEASQTGKQLYALAFAFSLTPVSVSSTEYSTFSQGYCVRICSVFFCTNWVKESMLPETFSPAFFLAATSVL